MNVLDVNKIKNKDYVVLLPRCDYDIRDSVEYSFENVFYLDYELTKEHADILIEFINNKANKLIVFDYDEFYRQVLPYIRKNKKNAGYKTKHVLLDIKSNNKKTKKSNSIGLIGNDYNPNHNTYNQLSALKLVDYSYVKIIKNMPATEHFIDFFNIKEKRVENIEEVMKDNFINLYCNFTANDFELVLKSMDMNIPCLLGNTDIFDKFPKLKKYLVLESDDDINEIASKINTIKENKEDILKEYAKFRKKYSEESKKIIEKLLK